MPTYRFDRHELVPESRRLRADGRDVVVGLRVFDVVAYLVENRHRAVGRDELIAAVWGRSDAGEALLAQAVLKARRLFGDNGEVQHHIRTIPRFGYQWVAPTSRVDADDGPAPAAAEADPLAVDDVGMPLSSTVPPRPPLRRPRRRFVVAAACLALLAALALVSTGRLRLRSEQTTAIATKPGLILVLPADVQGLVAEDGWMRLGLMSLGTQALADVPDHAVVPDETTLAAVARAGPSREIARLREETGASTVIATEATRSPEGWLLHATVFDAAGGTQIVSAAAADPVVAGGALARSLRDLFAPEGSDREHRAPPPEVLALSARMKAAILEGQNGRALALLERAAPATTAAPEVALLRAEALNQLGRMDEAVAVLHALTDGAATDPAPRWLPEAWTALGDCELAKGRPDLADAHFRRALALQRGDEDRRSAGLAWRGLAIAQAVRNDLDGAEASYLNARLALEPIGDRLVLARVVDGLGYVTAQRGRLADALLRYRQAAEIAAAIGSNETELGSRLNIAQSQEYLLQHETALASLRELLPRLRGLDYPALHRFGIVAYANVLTETGAFDEARSELALLDAESPPDATYDAVVDVRLDTARCLLALGDADGARRLAEAIRAGLDGHGAADLRLEAAAVLMAALSGHDETAADALAADAAIWQPGDALAPARVHALVAQARWNAARGDVARATGQFAQAQALAEGFGAPVVLRDAVVPHAGFLLAQRQDEAAARIARTLGPYADGDFASALLLARVALARGDAALARSYFTKARQLAGQRWSDAVEREAAASEAAPVVKKPGDTTG